MKFKMRLQPSQAFIDLTPLVDVVFLLLIFFIVTSDILPLKSLLIENPQLAKNSTPLTTQLLLVVDAEQVIYLGSKKSIVDLQTLKEEMLKEIDLLKKHHRGAEPTLVLSVDRRVEYGIFLQIFSIAQECFKTLRLVYQPIEA